MSDFKHLLSLQDLTQEQILGLLELAAKIKKTPADYGQTLAGKSVVTLFEKPSLRTRVTFDIGINRLGGHAVYLDQQNGAMGERESVKDFASNITRWADAIVARVFSHKTLQTLREHSSVPIINSLCDLYHPCQGLADFQTIAEHYSDLSKVKLAYLGDGNNVTHSLLLGGAILGMEVAAVCPLGSSPDAQVVQKANQLAKAHGGKIVVTNTVEDIKGYDVVYGDTWVSMGDDTPLQSVKDKFMAYQINQNLMQQCGINHVLHCQPAHRELEITSEVMDGPQSLIFDQAENRMHAQNAVLVSLLS
ncbi:ornithine carbamoyltransferase [Agarivorans sp. OAG1]|uniref:Ornithine carbamoyltransferase n=1 Tax=Agarivorans albus MKT 106 TaxID=1331007 RepID=R9PR06_AGAAL|nr:MULTISPECIES: ornithine carbamoyltransferase [Agarivorans]MPW30023.1 ornithine carbamoyltransferase [Agarivorans sp. B2Z047]UQN43592.1 ornithine carbamoyltransferase [Agarivorans sp. B2Z047]BEU04878.1 ornithine carbamoyltransferase [Agarivorans sp. OAG1]GAD03718.1 ornithine carbamoyltransferase [Agarivorans albus MKT 106]